MTAIVPASIRRQAAYLHVAKCAGTSLTQALVHAAGSPSQPEARLDSCYTFGPHGRTELLADAQLMILDESLEERPGQHVFETHWSLRTLRRWFDLDDIATVLREPRMRLLSYVLFAHTRTQAQRRRWYPDDLGARMVQIPLVELLAWEQATRAIDNLVVRQVLWGDERIIGDRFIDSNEAGQLADDASAQISQFGFAGVIEASDHAVNGLGEWLGTPLDVGHSNRTVDVTYPGLIRSAGDLDAIQQLLLDRTSSDQLVWANLAQRCGVGSTSPTDGDAVTSRLRQLCSSSSFAVWSRKAGRPIDSAPQVLAVGSEGVEATSLPELVGIDGVHLTRVVEGNPHALPGEVDGDVATVNDLRSVDLRALLAGRDFDHAIALAADSEHGEQLAYQLADSVVAGGRIEIHSATPIELTVDSAMWLSSSDGTEHVAAQGTRWRRQFSRTDVVASVRPYRAAPEHDTIGAMESDPQQPITDWSRYGEPIILDNPTDSRAIVLGLLDGEPQRILELGCSAGLMTQILHRRGHRLTGIEIDPKAAALAESSTEYIIVGDLDDDGPDDVLARLDDTYDVVLAADVLEHLRNPLGCLRRAVGALAPGGIVILSIPNVAHGDVRLALFAGRFDYRDNGLLDRTHVQMFTLASLVEMIREAGLVPVSWLRSSRPVGSTEIKIDEALFEFGSRVFAGDPEVDTYQWIVTCRRVEDPAVVADWPDLGDNGVASVVGRMLDITIPRPAAASAEESEVIVDVSGVQRLVGAARRRVGAALRSVRR
jgi:2-polyprenyl-3-methyl-5-hydroxy-6-metoxy-1,4-benzoquinol methylase